MTINPDIIILERHTYTAKQDAFLIANPNLTHVDAGKILGKSASSVKNRRFRLWKNGRIERKPTKPVKVRTAAEIEKFKVTMAASKVERAEAAAARQNWPRVTCTWRERLGERRYDEPATW